MPRTEEQFQEIREKTKLQIRNSALKLFARKGFNGTSISNIAKDAKISKGLIYNYFESKVAIVEDLYASLIIEMQQMMEPIRVINNPYKQIEELISQTIKYTNENRDYWKLYMNFMLQPAPITFQNIFSAEIFQEFFKEFERMFEKLGVKNPKLEAYEFAALLDGLQIHLLFIAESYPLEEMKNHFIKKYSKAELSKRK